MEAWSHFLRISSQFSGILLFNNFYDAAASFEGYSLQLLLMIVCALQSLQRSISTDGKHCFSTISELSNNYQNVVSLQRLRISFEVFYLLGSGNLFDQNQDKQKQAQAV